MTRLPREIRIRLARLTLPLGKGQERAIKYEPCSILPSNLIRFEIPVALIEEMLARKGQQPTQPTDQTFPAKPQKPRLNLTLPLARIVMSLDAVPRKTPDEQACPTQPPQRTEPTHPNQPTIENLIEQVCRQVRSGMGSRPVFAARLKRSQSISRPGRRYPLLMSGSGVMNVTTARDKPLVQGEAKMPTFTINDDNNITVFNSAAEAAQTSDSAATVFDSQAALKKISAAWPLSRLVDIWNSIPGQREVRTFTHRGKAVARIWKAIQPLAKNGASQETEAAPTESPRETKTTKKGKPTGKRQAAKSRKTKETSHKASERSNKKATVIAMMKRNKGATLAEIMEATSWQAHTVRGFVSILGSKGGQKVTSSKNAAGERTYRIAR
jgi:hypothetical protein